MAKIAVLIAIVLVGLVNASLFAESEKRRVEMGKYDWLPSECAMETYPMKILEADFIFEDGRSLYIPSGKIVANGMGNVLSTHVVGPDLKPLPEKLYIHWFSYVEDKFYEGTFDLPSEKIKDLFMEGFKSPKTGEHITYRRILVGLAPEGDVSIFLMAHAVTLEVANFNAMEVQTEWGQFIDNEDLTRDEYINIMLEGYLSVEQAQQLKAGLMLSNIWHTYKKQYPWTPEVIGQSPFKLWIESFNGENEFFDLLKFTGERTHRAMPKELSVSWISSNNKSYLARITLNEEHVIETFQHAFETYPDETAALEMRVVEKPRTPERRKILRTVEVYLKIKDERIRLKVDKLDVF